MNVILSLIIVAPLGPYLYRIAYQPMAEASVLTLLIASVGAHFALLGLGLVFFGPEGLSRAGAVVGEHRARARCRSPARASPSMA